MGIAIGGVALLVLLVVGIHWFRHRHDVIYVDTQEEADVIHAFGDPNFHRVVVRDCEDDCPCRHGHPHHHLIDQHQDVLRRHPDSFVALHPMYGVVFATTDILELTLHMNKLDHNKSSALAVVHTSVLQLPE
jgi:hypothetical protein